MTIINEKENTLQIIIKTTAPDEERAIIFKALCAAIRWHGTCTNLITKQSTDGENLHTLASLMESLVDVQTIKA